MNRQRGIAQAYLILIVLAGISLALWYAYQTIDSRGYARGKTETEATYAKRDNDALRAANARIQALQTEARALEAMRVVQVNEIAVKYQQDNDNAKKRVADLNARLQSGDLRLRDPGARCPAASGNGGLPPAGPGAPGSDGGAAPEFSRTSAEFLFKFAADADDTAARLSACQAIVRADRK